MREIVAGTEKLPARPFFPDEGGMLMAMMTKIYALCEPDGEIRYIGKTIRSLSARFSAHLARARGGEKSYLFSWLRSVLSTGHLPLIQLVGEVEGNGSKEEIAWIAYGRQEGWRLVNLTDGGEGALGYVPSAEARRKTSEANKGRVSWNKGKHHSKETRKKLSEINKGKHPTEETRHKMSEAGRGRICSEETRRKMREAQKGLRKGAQLSLETRIKIGKANIGKHFRRASEETRRKLHDSHIGKPNGCLGTHRSKESRLKMSLAKKGKSWTEVRLNASKRNKENKT